LPRVIDFERRFDSEATRSATMIDDSPQHLAPTSRRHPIRANCMDLAHLRSKLFIASTAKKNLKIFDGSKTKTPLV
jgi:hypothetical protein